MKGSISIFFACIMLCLISFMVSILDISRINNFQVISSNNLLTSGKLALSQYDPVLFNEYGLFAGEKGEHINKIVEDSLTSMYDPKNAKKTEFLLDYMEDKNDATDEVVNYYSPRTFEVDIRYRPLFYNGVEEFEKQIIDYMKIQLPFIAVEGIAAKFDLLSKGTKSSKLVEDKNTMVQKLNNIIGLKKELYEITDGIILNEDGSYQLTEERSYLRSIRYQEGFSCDYFPLDIQETMTNRSVDIETLLQRVRENLLLMDEKLLYLLRRDNYRISFPEDVEEEAGIPIEEFQELHWLLYAHYEADLDAKEVFQELKDEIQPIVESLRDEILRINKILESNERACEIMNEIEASSSNSLQEINQFEMRLEEEEEVVPGLEAELLDELQSIKRDMIDQDRVGETQVGNLSYIKEIIVANEVALSNALLYGNLLENELEAYIYRRYISLYEQEHRNESESIIQDFETMNFEEKCNEQQKKVLEAEIKNLMTFGVDTTETEFTGNDIQYIERLILLFEQPLEEYKNAIVFDYTQLGDRIESSDAYDEKASKLQGFDIVKQLQDSGIIQYFPSLQFDESKMPSHQLNTGAVVEENTLDEDFFKSVSNSFLINEYILGMFNNASNTLNPNAKSISGYRLSDHFINSEVEYILEGSPDRMDNLKKVIQKIVGIRTGANLLHLLTNREKRLLIQQLATSLSGWWGGAIATAWFVVLIGGIWALFESIADVMMLLSGKSIPFLKTKSTWYTSLDGSAEDLFNTAIQDAQNATTTLLSRVKEEMTKLWSDLMKEMDGVYVEGMDDLMERMAVDISGQIEQNQTLIEQEMNEFIVQCCKESTVENPFDIESEAYTLAEEIRTKILATNEEDDSEVGECKIKEIYKNQIQELLTKSADQMVNLVRMDMDVLKSTIKKEIEKGMDGAITQTNTLIEQKADEWKKKAFEGMENENASKTSLLTQMMSFDYKDYLRILLLLSAQSDDMKILRSLDLIQWNLQKNREEYDLELMSYFSGIELYQKADFDTWVLPKLSAREIDNRWQILSHEEVMY